MIKVSVHLKLTGSVRIMYKKNCIKFTKYKKKSKIFSVLVIPIMVCIIIMSDIISVMGKSHI